MPVSMYASWNPSVTAVAVTSNGLTRLTVYNMKTRRVVRQAFKVLSRSL